MIEVTSKFYDNGNTEITSKEVEIKKPEFEEGKKCDIYRDYFDTQKEANEFMDQEI